MTVSLVHVTIRWIVIDWEWPSSLLRVRHKPINASPSIATWFGCKNGGRKSSLCSSTPLSLDVINILSKYFSAFFLHLTLFYMCYVKRHWPSQTIARCSTIINAVEYTTFLQPYLQWINIWDPPFPLPPPNIPDTPKKKISKKGVGATIKPCSRLVSQYESQCAPARSFPSIHVGLF